MSHDRNQVSGIALGVALLASAAVGSVGCKDGNVTKKASAAPAQGESNVVVTANVGAEDPATGRGPSTGTTADRISRGKYLVTIAACDDCHTPMRFDAKLGMPVPDMTRKLSGHPEGAPGPEAKPGPHDQAVIGPTFTSFRLPFGTVYTANLTPDPETGLGRWDAATFIATMRTGRHLGSKTGRPIIPPMPWNYVAQMTDDDLKAVFAYLRSIPAVKNHVPPPEVPPDALEKLGKSYDAMLSSPAK